MKKRYMALAAALAMSLPSGPAAADSNPLQSQIMTVAFDFCPRGWLEPSGQVLEISGNEALFALLGTAYGGNGSQTFGLPDLPPKLTADDIALKQCIAADTGLYPSQP